MVMTYLLSPTFPFLLPASHFCNSRLAPCGVFQNPAGQRPGVLTSLFSLLLKSCSNSGYLLLSHLKINGAEFCEHSESNKGHGRTQNGTGHLCPQSHHHLQGTSAPAAAEHKHLHGPGRCSRQTTAAINS